MLEPPFSPLDEPVVVVPVVDDVESVVFVVLAALFVVSSFHCSQRFTHCIDE